jgi:hypothetical protein
LRTEKWLDNGAYFALCDVYQHGWSSGVGNRIFRQYPRNQERRTLLEREDMPGLINASPVKAAIMV